MKKLLLLLLLIIPLLSFSQTFLTIKGYVGDSVDRKVLPYASVIVKSPISDTIYYGAITDTNGYFELKKISIENDFDVKINFIGYETFLKHYSIKNTKSRIMVIASLKPAKNKLKEVVIKGNNRKEEVNKTTILVDSSLLANSVTTIDVLKKIPEIRVNPITNTASIKGKENAFVMVNGVMTNRNINLRSINPNTIEKIEIINIPSSEFDNSIDGVINIVLKDNSSSINAYSENEYLPHKALNSYNGFMFNHKKSSLGIDYSFENKHYDFKLKTHRILPNKNNEYFYNADCEKNKDINNEINLHYDYHFSKKTLFSIYSSNYFYKADKIFNTSSINTIDYTSRYYLLSSYEGKTNVVNSSTTIFYKKQLNKKGLKFTVNNNFTTNNSDYTLNYLDTTIIPEDKITYRFYKDNSGYISDNFIPKISIPFKKSNLETGIVAFYKSFKNNYSANEDLQKINYWIFKTNYFVDLRGSLHKLQYQLGLKYENYKYHIYNFEYSDYSIQPSFYLFKKLNEHNIFRFSYTDRSSFPSIWQVSSQNQMSDSLNYYAGNKNIKPMYTHKLSLAYKFKKKEDMLDISLNAKYYKDMIFTYYSVNEDNVLTTKPLNIDKKLRSYVNVNGTKVLFDLMSFDYDVDFYRENFINKNDNRVNYSWKGSFMLYVVTHFDIIFGGMYDYYGKTLTYQGTYTQSPNARIFVGLRLFDDMARLTLSYTFFDSQEETIIEQPDFNHFDKNTVMVKGLFFRFNFYFYKGKDVKMEDYEKHIDLDTK